MTLPDSKVFWYFMGWFSAKFMYWLLRKTQS